MGGGVGGSSSTGLGVPWFRGCPGLGGIPRFGGPGCRRAGLDRAGFSSRFGANVASTPVPPILFFQPILRPAVTFLGTWPVPSVSPCVSPPRVTRGQRAQPGRLPRTGVHGEGGRGTEQPPSTLPCPTGDKGPRVDAGRRCPSGGRSTPWYGRPALSPTLRARPPAVPD